MIIKGSYLDGKTSKRVQARLEVLKDQMQCRLHALHETSEPEKISLDFSSLKIESRLGNTPREIAFGENQLFISDDHEGVDTLLQLQSPSFYSGLIHKIERNLVLVITATLLTLGILWLTFSKGIPKTAEYIAFNFTSFTTEYFGSTLSILDETLFDPSNLEKDRQAEIQALAKPFMESDPSLNAKLVFRSSSSANAFALPDGHIVFTDDIVKLAKNDEQLLAILFHEIGHLKYKHLLRRALQDSMITMALILIIGDLDSIDIITGLPTLLLDLHYSKDFESEADYYAIEQLHNNNMPVDAFANIMKGLDEESFNDDDSAETQESSLAKLSEYLSTHPTTQARVDMVADFKNNLNTQK